MRIKSMIIDAFEQKLKFELVPTPQGRSKTYMPNSLRQQITKIPGMLSISTAQLYYIISAHQAITGNIIEIGAWQGRSTVALGRSCELRGRGEKVHVFDHFLGNPGNEKSYIVKDRNLEDLQGNFKRNISNSNLDDFVDLHSVDVDTVDGSKFQGIRMLVIDGEHTYEAVLRNYNTFRGSLLPSSLIIFDDFREDAPGVIRAVSEINGSEPESILSVFGATAVLSI